MKNIEKTLNLKKKLDFATLLLDLFQRRIFNFDHVKVNKLLSHRKHDHIIRLIENKKFEFDLLYNMFKDELLVLDKYIKNNIVKKFIRNNQFEIASFVLFVRKLEKNIRLCVDYRDLNVITIKNRYSLFLFKKILMRLCRVKHFNIIDIIVAFNKFRMIFEKK